MKAQEVIEWSSLKASHVSDTMIEQGKLRKHHLKVGKKDSTLETKQKSKKTIIDKKMKKIRNNTCQKLMKF